MLNMDFTKVTFDEDVDELEGDEARELVSDFATAQEQNIAEFEEASEKIDDLEGTFGEFEDADEELTAEVAEATFMSEDEAATLDFSRKREILAEQAEESEEQDFDEEEDEDAEFSNFGTRGETHGDDEEGSAVAEEYLGGIQGLNF